MDLCWCSCAAVEQVVCLSGLLTWIRVLLSELIWLLLSCLFSLLGLCVGHSLTWERLTDSRKATIPLLRDCHHCNCLWELLDLFVLVLLWWPSQRECVCAEALKTPGRMQRTNAIAIVTSILWDAWTWGPQVPRTPIPEARGINLVDLRSPGAKYSLFYLTCVNQVSEHKKVLAVTEEPSWPAH